jgi:DNA-binding CsgD family transcriptional regulator
MFWLESRKMFSYSVISMSGPQRHPQRRKRKLSNRGADRPAGIFVSNRKAILKLAAATTTDQYWAATQALIATAAPCSTRWLCVRPIRMTTAMMLLRETAAAPGRNGTKTNGRSQPGEREAALLKELFARHPAVLHFRKNSGAPLVHLGPEEMILMHGSRHEQLRGCDWASCAALAFWGRKQMQGFLLLHRAEHEGDFSEAELRALRNLHPHLETALSRVIAGRRHQAHKYLLAEILKPLPLPLVLCDWRLNIVCESAAGREARAIWELGQENARTLNHSGLHPLPPDLAALCRSRIEAWVKAGPRRRRALEKDEHALAHPSMLRLRAKVRIVRQRRFPIVEPLLLLKFESQLSHRHLVGAEHTGTDQFPLLARLSPCERELALLVCEGHSNARVASQLGKSGCTIKAQLHSIFEKLQVKSRSKLVALLMRTSIHLLLCFSFDTIDALLAGI